ncbi:uncharacterized protein LOC126771735 isoform X2 [Nymphalis io]|nr:uncharacterized protein LOC126771735 isoform X2 [Nymphalis io]XP_050347747.1 uncharacterized protein LOC126771735 isoform X2 [Nymphalis io]
MFSNPGSIHDFLLKNNYINKIYDALKNEDLSEVVMVTKKIIETTQELDPLSKISKCKETSEKYREMGNKAYNSNNYQHCLMFYNQALLHAPNKSKEFKLALSNRSALFLKLKEYRACIKDISTCLLSECPPEIIGKLNKRMETATKLIKSEELKTFNKSVEISINCDITSNIQVPCASTDVTFTGSVLPKVLASKEIKVGTVVAYEKAYVSYTDPLNALFACHYCQRQSLNLIPCNNCTVAFYCDQECKLQCFTEYHKYECYLMDAYKIVCPNAKLYLMIKSLLKLTTKCNSWTELIRESQNMGLERMKKSSIEEIFDRNSIFSVLNIKDDRPFIYGSLYNTSFICGVLLHYMECIPSFFPTDSNLKQQAMRAVSRIMLFLCIHQVPQQSFQVVTNVTDGLSYIHQVKNYSIYSFIGKLKTSCNPNSFLINNNSKMILLAIRTIKSGEELTISSQQHWLDGDLGRHSRNINSYLCSGTVCDCPISNGEGSLRCKGQLSKSQRVFYNSLNVIEFHAKLKLSDVTEVFNYLLEIMDVLQDVPYSEEYDEIFKRFRKCIFYFEALKGNNVTLEKISFSSSGTRTGRCIDHSY